jgi:hypothetical protein
MEGKLFPEDCLIPVGSQELFARIAGNGNTAPAAICKHKAEGKCAGGNGCDKVPVAEPFPKKERFGMGGFPT